MIKNIDSQLGSNTYNPSIWSSDYLQNEYSIPLSPNIQKFTNLSNNFQVHPPVLIIHKSDDPRKRALKENDDILPEITLPGQLISIIRSNGGKADINYILEKIEPLFPHLRRINGRRYSGKLMKTVIGGLHSTEIFQFDPFHHVWELKEDLAKKYEQKTLEKFKLLQKKISKKKKANETQIKRKYKNFELKKTDPKKYNQDSIKKNEFSNEIPHNPKYFDFHPESSFQNECGNFLLNEGNEMIDYKKEDEMIFENHYQKQQSSNNFGGMNQFNPNDENLTNKSNEKEHHLKKKKRIYKRSYEKYNIAFKSLEKVIEYMMEKNYSNLIKNPFSNLNGNETPEEIIPKIGTDNIIGVIRCFDYFKPLIIDSLEKKNNKLKSLLVKGDHKKSNFLVNVAKDVSDIKNKLNNIFNQKN